MNKENNPPRNQKSAATAAPSGSTINSDLRKERDLYFVERMERFPKPNTMPEKWDLSEIYKD